MTKPVWRFAEAPSAPQSASVAVFQAGDWEARVDVRYPQKGVHAIRVGGDEFPAAYLLAAEVARGDAEADVADQYIRGADLVATLAPDPGTTIRPQIYWRSLKATGGVLWGLELILSMQTGLLHSEPACTTRSELAAGEVWRLQDDASFEFRRLEAPSDREVVCTPDDGGAVFLLRTADARFSYAQMVYPSDFHRTTITFRERPVRGMRIEHQLFPEPLEKGVIRRGRIRGWMLRRQDDLAAAAEQYHAWLREPPPLTT